MSDIISIANLTLSTSQQTLLQLPEFRSKLGEVHAVLGESGSGKSLLLKCLIGLLPPNITASGDIQVHIPGIDITELNHWTPKDWYRIRGKQIGMVFQEPLSALNPQMTCGAQLQEAWDIHAAPSNTNSKSEIR